MNHKFLSLFSPLFVLLFSIALSAAAVGCGVSPRRGHLYGGGTVNGGGGGATTSQTGQASADPRTALNEVDQLMQQSGYRPVGSAVRNPNMPPNGMIAYAIEAQSSQCYVAIAIGQQTSNLNMVVLDPAGQTIGANVDPGARPFVTVCGAQGRLTARLQMLSGGGEYYYVAYQGAAGSQPDLAGLLGGRVQATGQQAQLDPTTNQRLQALDAQLRGEGFTPLMQTPYGEQLGEREERFFNLNLEAGRCYVFATLGGPGTTDTDVFVQDASGTQLARDNSTNIDAVARYCPTASGSYRMRALLFGGQGPLFATGYVQGGAGSSNAIGTAQQGGGVEERYRLLDADIRARGYETYGDVSRGELQQGGSQQYTLQLEGGKCYAILAVGDNGVRDLDLILNNSGGQEIDRDVETDGNPIVRVCAEQTGQYTIQISMYSGQGSFVYAPYRWPRGTRGPFGLAGLIYVRLAEVTALLGVEGFEPDVDSAPGQGRINQGQTRNHNISLQQGQCYAVLAVGGDGITNLDVSIQNGGRAVATDQTRTAFPRVTHCAESAGQYQVNVGSSGGSGQYFYQVFRRN